jgi:hypothetical protein
MACLGCVLIGIGFAIFCVSAFFIPEKKPDGVSGFDAETAELLTRPAHEVLARQLAAANGAPEFMWRKYTPLAVSEIIARRGR